MFFFNQFGLQHRVQALSYIQTGKHVHVQRTKTRRSRKIVRSGFVSERAGHYLQKFVPEAKQGNGGNTDPRLRLRSKKTLHQLHL